MENFISEEDRIREGLYISICILQIISVKVINLKLNRSDEWITRYYSCPFLLTAERALYASSQLSQSTVLLAGDEPSFVQRKDSLSLSLS
ncbi:hypothetical protein HZH68_001184 [Vespula germanica]|uniref:Uncharacterized protein n=1 Tax=Vespula germanica TaxID=30212 RepID=A0A834U6L1_VESGE|nr:hypothetical protein HZH68_001184 [Vespula germanica]